MCVMRQRRMDNERIAELPRSVFQPRPKVDPGLLRLSRKKAKSEADPQLFEWLVRELFTQRRRLVRGALKHSLKRFRPELVDAIVQRMEVPVSRVFQLSPAEFESLAKDFEDALNDNSIVSAEIMQGHLKRKEDS